MELHTDQSVGRNHCWTRWLNQQHDTINCVGPRQAEWYCFLKIIQAWGTPRKGCGLYMITTTYEIWWQENIILSLGLLLGLFLTFMYRYDLCGQIFIFPHSSWNSEWKISEMFLQPVHRSQWARNRAQQIHMYWWTTQFFTKPLAICWAHLPVLWGIGQCKCLLIHANSRCCFL